MDQQRYEKGAAIRRQIIGDDRVAALSADKNPINTRWQSFVTEFAWGECWADPTLNVRERTILTIGIAATQGRQEELEGHLRNVLRGGFSIADLEAMMVHITVYCGVPVGSMYSRTMQKLLADSPQQAKR